MKALRNSLLLAVAVLLSSLPSLSQVTVTANLTDGTGTTYRTAFLHFQLVNCGANTPAVTGIETIVQDSFDLRPATPGSTISGTVIGNDQITCGGIASTYYVVTPMKDATHPLRDGQPYVICSSSSVLTTCGNPVLGTFNLVTALPMTQTPVAPGLIQIYGNPTKSQTLDQPAGTEMNFQGTMNFCSATVLCGNGGNTGGGFYQSMFYGTGAPLASLGGSGSYYLNLAASPVEIWQNNFGMWGDTGIGVPSSLTVHSSNYNVVTGDAVTLLIFNGSNLTATLPASLLGLGSEFFFLNESTTSLTVAGNGHTISGSATATIPPQSFFAVTINAAGTAYNLTGFMTLLADAGQSSVQILGNVIALNSASGSQVIAGAPAAGGGFFLGNDARTAQIQNTGTSNIAITGNVGITGNSTVTGSLIVNTVATSPSTSPICPNGTGGAFTTVGCTGGSGGGVSGSGTAGQLAVWTGPSSIGNASINASSTGITFGSPSSLTGIVGVAENNAYNGSGSTCSDSVSVPIGLASCSGYKLLDQAAPTSNLGYMAGLSIVAENTLHNTSKLIGIYVNAESGTTGVTTDEYGGYVYAEEGVSTTVTNRHGLYVLAYNDTPNTSALNEGLTVQTGGNGGTTNTLDYTIHVLAPANGDTLTTHAGIEVDAQGTGVPFQLKPQAFSTLPACSATYEGSHASVNDSTTATWGATISGSSTHHVSAYCDGTNWTVEGS